MQIMEIQKTALRLPKPLHVEIHKAAKESGRSMNAEIVKRLQSSFELPDITYDQLLEDISGIIDTKVDELAKDKK